MRTEALSQAVQVTFRLSYWFIASVLQTETSGSLLLHFSPFICSQLWQLQPLSWRRTARREKATRAPYALSRGRQPGNTDRPLCAVDTSLASCASSGGSKQQVHLPNVHRLAAAQTSNRKSRQDGFSHILIDCVFSSVQQESKTVRHCQALCHKTESTWQFWAGDFKEVSDLDEMVL